MHSCLLFKKYRFIFVQVKTGTDVLMYNGPPLTESHSMHICSFCGKRESEVSGLLSNGLDGIDAASICNECTLLSAQSLKLVVGPMGEPDAIENPQVERILSPREIVAFLNQYVVGQLQAKETLAIAVHNHYKRLRHPKHDGVELSKSNVLMVGPTGTGKTLLAQSVARLLDVPFTICDATSLTEAGYVGDDVETILQRLVLDADGDVDADEDVKARIRLSGGATAKQRAQKRNATQKRHAFFA